MHCWQKQLLLRTLRLVEIIWQSELILIETSWADEGFSRRPPTQKEAEAKTTPLTPQSFIVAEAFKRCAP
jgi:hypothetical protein